MSTWADKGNAVAELNNNCYISDVDNLLENGPFKCLDRLTTYHIREINNTLNQYKNSIDKKLNLILRLKFHIYVLLDQNLQGLQFYWTYSFKCRRTYL